MALSSFADQKATRIFDVFDADGDGVARQSDLDLAGSRAGSAFAHEPGSPAMRSLAQANSDLWQLLAAADTDHDGAVSLADFKAALPGLVASPSFAAVLDQLFEALVQVADADGDGRLTHDEYVRLFTARAGVSSDDASAAFARLDGDSDGLATAGEIKAAIRDFHLSDDHGSSGGWLLGSLA